MSSRRNSEILALKKALKPGSENGRTVKDLADEQGIDPERTAKQIADLIKARYPVLWDGKHYFTPRNPTEVMDFAVQHPQHFQTILYCWALGFRIKLKLEQKANLEQKEKMNVRKTDTNT